MDVIGKRKYYLGFAALIVLLSWVLILTLGLKQGIDLKGGTQWQVVFPDQNLSLSQVSNALAKVGNASDISLKQSSDGSFLIRLPNLSEDQHQNYLVALKTLGNPEEKSFASIGPAIGAELRIKALWAIGLVILGISLYIAWAFRKVSEPVKSWKYGVITLITLLHDVSIPSGLLAILGAWKGIEIDTNFIVALLVVMGFSVHDTIVVFDRIRENLILNRGRSVNLGQIINYSVKETLARSINTSLTLFLVLVALLIVGPTSLFYFILTILVGTIFGTYSSIFVASPLLYLWQKKRA